MFKEKNSISKFNHSFSLAVYIEDVTRQVFCTRIQKMN